MQNVTYHFFFNSHYYGSYDVISTYIYAFCAVVFLLFVKTVIVPVAQNAAKQH